MPQKQNLNWRQEAIGMALTRAEEVQLQNLLPNYRGDALACFDPYISQKTLAASPIKQRVYLASSQLIEVRNSLILADFDELPFLSDSLDIIIMPHVLDFANNQKRIIKEAWRATAPEGHVIILGFNRNSLFGLPKILRQEEGATNLLPPTRIRKMLQAQGFYIERFKTFYFRPAVENTKWLHQLRFMEIFGQFFWSAMGCIYCIIAQKPVLGMTPLYATNTKQRQRFPKAVVEPIRKSYER